MRLAVVPFARNDSAAPNPRGRRVAMSSQTVVGRLDRLERRVDLLEALPQRIDNLELQLVQFREEVRDEFSAVRTELRAQGDELRAEMQALGVALRAEMKAGDEETRTLMRILHEDVIARLKLIQEGGAAPRPKSQTRPRNKTRR